MNKVIALLGVSLAVQGSFNLLQAAGASATSTVSFSQNSQHPFMDFEDIYGAFEEAYKNTKQLHPNAKFQGTARDVFAKSEVQRALQKILERNLYTDLSFYHVGWGTPKFFEEDQTFYINRELLMNQVFGEEDKEAIGDLLEQFQILARRNFEHEALVATLQQSGMINDANPSAAAQITENLLTVYTTRRGDDNFQEDRIIDPEDLIQFLTEQLGGGAAEKQYFAQVFRQNFARQHTMADYSYLVNGQAPRHEGVRPAAVSQTTSPAHFSKPSASFRENAQESKEMTRQQFKNTSTGVQGLLHQPQQLIAAPPKKIVEVVPSPAIAAPIVPQIKVQEEQKREEKVAIKSEPSSINLPTTLGFKDDLLEVFQTEALMGHAAAQDLQHFFLNEVPKGFLQAVVGDPFKPVAEEGLTSLPGYTDILLKIKPFVKGGSAKNKMWEFVSAAQSKLRFKLEAHAIQLAVKKLLGTALNTEEKALLAQRVVKQFKERCVAPGNSYAYRSFEARVNALNENDLKEFFDPAIDRGDFRVDAEEVAAFKDLLLQSLKRVMAEELQLLHRELGLSTSVSAGSGYGASNSVEALKEFVRLYEQEQLKRESIQRSRVAALEDKLTQKGEKIQNLQAEVVALRHAIQAIIEDQEQTPAQAAITPAGRPRLTDNTLENMRKLNEYVQRPDFDPQVLGELKGEAYNSALQQHAVPLLRAMYPVIRSYLMLAHDGDAAKVDAYLEEQLRKAAEAAN